MMHNPAPLSFISGTAALQELNCILALGINLLYTDGSTERDETALYSHLKLAGMFCGSISSRDVSVTYIWGQQDCC